MPHTDPTANSLVLYKVRPARVLTVGDKIEIELEGGKTKRVRPKDVALLHPGPVSSLAELEGCSGDVEEAWELLAGGRTDLRELAELVYDRFSPASAWAAWQLVADGLYFEGSPAEIQARSAEAVERDRSQREAKAAAEEAWEGFLTRMGRNELADEDRERLQEVESLALGQREASRILRSLGLQESREVAHRLLIRVGYWGPHFNPYPHRLGLSSLGPEIELPGLPAETRRDLTHLPAFAIDDEGNQDPDDAISLDRERVWVHIADVAAVVGEDSEAEAEARARGANLYLPEGIVPMLPGPATSLLGLGLADRSPALSVGFRLDADGAPDDIEVTPSWVRVKRLTYAAVNGRMGEEPFAGIARVARIYRERRNAAGASNLELPEVSVRVVDGRVVVRPVPRVDSRDMVTDAMLMAGEAVARFAIERGVVIPFAGQAAPDSPLQPGGLAEMFACRKRFKPSQLAVQPEPHAGLGLALYTRATSPLRRYSDLLVHQQLRAYLRGADRLPGEEVALRIAQAERGAALVRKAERFSNQHWKLVYLTQNPGWRGEGILVDLDDNRGTFLLPELALEAKLRVRDGVGLDDRRLLAVREVDIPELTARFQIRG